MIDEFARPETATPTSLLLKGLAMLLVAHAACQPALAKEEPEPADEHLRAAELALQQHEYRKAAIEFHEAAILSGEPAIARRATRVAYTYGFNEIALDSALRWTEVDEENDEALLYVAQLQLRLGQLRKARRNFRQLLERGEEPVEDRLLDLVPILSQEDAGDAYRLMAQLARPYRKSAQANYAVGVLALQADDHEEAAERAQKALAIEPEWIKPKLLYSRALLLAGEEEEAIDYAARIVGDDPDPDPEARLELAILYVSAGRDDDALSQVNQILLEQPSRTDALRLMAIINFRLENLDAARADFEDLLATGQYTMDALYYLARIADYRGDIERALTLYSQVTRGPHTIISQRRASGIIAREVNLEGALDHLQRFGDRHPSFAVDMVLAQAQLLASQHELERSLEIYDRVVSYRPEDENVILGRAEVLLRLDKVDEALAEYRRAVRLWPDSASALNALGYTLTYHSKDYNRAARLIRKALEIEPDSPAIIDSYGWVLYRLGEHEEALAQLERAWDMMRDPEIGLHLVEVLAALGRCDEADAMLGEAVALDADHPLLDEVRELPAACRE